MCSGPTDSLYTLKRMRTRPPRALRFFMIYWEVRAFTLTLKCTGSYRYHMASIHLRTLRCLHLHSFCFTLSLWIRLGRREHGVECGLVHELEKGLLLIITRNHNLVESFLCQNVTEESPDDREGSGGIQDEAPPQVLRVI